jgi:Ala-tRNA(Pro) deacylase
MSFMISMWKYFPILPFFLLYNPGMNASERELLVFLDRHAIPYQRVEHPPVYTCEQAETYRPVLPGVSTKNLFLRDKRKQFYLAMTACEKRLDLKALGKTAGAPKLHFGDESDLMDLLSVTPGAVTVLGLVGDAEKRVQLWVDADIWEAETFLCHPLVNTATLVIARADLLRFFALTGHDPQVVDMPARDAA